MTLIHAKGNLIDMAEEGLFDIIVHGANCRNTMGSGIAKEIKARYPEAFSQDTWFANKFTTYLPIMKLGNYSIASVHGPLAKGFHEFKIINAYTQVDYLPRGIDHFEYDSFKLILRKLFTTYPKARFGFPWIGMGLAGGDGETIMQIIEDFSDEVNKQFGSVTVVEFA